MPPQTITAAADAGGNATALFNAGGLAYSIEQISVVAQGSSTGTAEVFLNRQFICGTSQGWLDSADGTPARPLSRGDQLTVVWAGVAPGSSCQAVLLGEQLL